jgi:hypothetical protein
MTPKPNQPLIQLFRDYMAKVHLECLTFTDELFKIFNAGDREFRFVRTAGPSEISCSEGVQAACERKARKIYEKMCFITNLLAV